MRRYFLPIAFSLLLILAGNAQLATAQHLVLFETVTNSCDPTGQAAFDERNTFNANVSSVVSSEASNIIHLDEHIANECDELQNGTCYQAAAHVFSNVEIEWGAVDRTVFGSTSTRGSGSSSDWTDAINAEAGKSPAATLELLDATLDKTNANNYQLHADVKVRLLSAFPDSLVIRYAIVQDSCVDNQNGGTNNVILNDVVRYITNSNSSPFFVVAGGSAEMQQTMTWDQQLHGPTNFNDAVHYNYRRSRLVAFLEETNGSSFRVVNAAVLRQDLDTLQAPAPTLVLNNGILDDSTFHPGNILPIQYTSSNLTNGVDAYYSLDDGATWRLISTNSISSPINWQVPDSLTTQGKIKLVASGDPALSSIETGTFTIGLAPSMSFIYPVNQVLRADSSYTIRWTNFEVGSVKLEYYLANSSGAFENAKVIADNIADTFYTWMPPDTNDAVEFQLIDDNNEAPAASSLDTIEKLIIEGSVQTAMPVNGLVVMGIFPNPAASGEEMVVRYSDNLPRPVSIEVLDLLGHLVGQFSDSNNGEIRLDTRALASGTYIVRVSDGASVVSKRVEILR